MTTSVPEQTDTPRRKGWAGVDLAAIWHLSRPVLEGQAATVERAVVAGIERMLTLDRQRQAGREAHKLAGSLGTFGFTAGSRLARELELALTAEMVVDAEHALELSALVVELRGEMQRPLSVHRPVEGDAQTAPAVLVVGADPDWARRVVEGASARGFPAQQSEDMDAALDVIVGAPPDVLVIDGAVATEEDVAALLSTIADHRPPIAAVVIATDTSLGGRIHAAREGARALLQRPAPPDVVVDAVARLAARSTRTATVLAVDDDPTFRMIIGEVLAAEGLSVESLGDAAELWPTLERVDPDLLLLDNEMPGFDGISLCRALRRDERWARLPVVFLSGSQSPDVVREMFAAGADDYVGKPVTAEDLVARVANRIERTRAVGERSDVDLGTGLLTARAFAKEAERLLDRAAREGAAATLALVELDPPTSSAVAALGRLLRQASGPEDLVGGWSGGRLATLTFGVTGKDGSDRVARVLRSARAEPGVAAPRASAGAAAFPEHAADLGALSAAAEAALGRARQAGEGSVELHQPAGGGRAEVVDVLVVDDDQALAALVVHALSGRGWTVRWLQDGIEAVELLDDPNFRARAVLLDVGLPGLDGIAVLRHLGRQGRLARTRVVMLTVRANENEVLEALDLGAFDHVAKPFSLAVLLHRVRRAVEAAG